jgi:hypothetical protein
MVKKKRNGFEPDIETRAFPQILYHIGQHADEHFARCILEDREPEFTPEDAKSAITGVRWDTSRLIRERPPPEMNCIRLQRERHPFAS